MQLREAVSDMDNLYEFLTIYARKPWSADSQVVLQDAGPSGAVPPELRTAGYEYFLQILEAREVLEVFSRPASLDEKVRLLLYYAENDAYPSWVYDR